MKRLASLLPALFVLAFATEAGAAARIVTPRLAPDGDGGLVCAVVNASDKKDVMVEITIYTFGGTAISGPIAFSISPNRSNALTSLDNTARHCVVVVNKGGKRNVRVSLATLNAAGDVTGAVSGF